TAAHTETNMDQQTWCHWSLELEAWRLLKADEIAVRAVDAQLNTQPSDPTWNLLGMMNNCWYAAHDTRHTPHDTHHTPHTTHHTPHTPRANCHDTHGTRRYRIRIEVQDEPTTGSTACIFKHPVQPGSLAGGWMINSRDEPHPPRAPDNDAAMNKRV